MIIDKELQVSDAQAITATAVSTNAIDLTKAGDILENLYLVVRVNVALSNAADDGTVTFSLIGATAADLTTGQVTYFSTSAIAEASLTAGTEPVKVRVPLGITTRYLGVKYTVGGTGNLNAGSVDAFFTPAVDTNVANAT